MNSAEHPITRNTLGEEGSFMGSMMENSRPLDSLRNYNFKKKNTALTLNSKREQKVNKKLESAGSFIIRSPTD